MARTITLRLSDAAYPVVRRYVEADRRSMNAWIEGLLKVEDTRRRCAAHQRFLTSHPEGVTFSAAWADGQVVRAIDRADDPPEFPRRDLPVPRGWG